MDLTLTLARFWGVVLVGSAIAILLNKNFLKEVLKLKDKKEYLLISGLVALLIGGVHVAIYNYWEVSIRGLITLFGWASLLKGIVRLAFPSYSKKAIGYVGKQKALYNFLLVLLGGIGIYFLYVGFVQ